jgi:DNA-binding transcriptional ArsR family regulator
MKAPLISFRAAFREHLLDLLWRQWTALGVAGQSAPWKKTPLDPEALVAVSCTAARHDPRLFDAMLDWLGANGRYLNVGRIRRMLTEYHFAGGAVYAAVAATTSTAEQAVKWARSAEHVASDATEVAEPRPEEPLFRLADGRPLPVVREPDPIFLAHGLLRDRYEPRGVAGQFRPEAAANLLLRLRALFGVSARCEILAYLLTNGRGSPRAVARACGYYPATVTKALTEMGDSGFVVSRVEGRHRHYTLVPEAWKGLLLGEARPAWIVWPALFAGLERTWLFLQRPELAGQSELAQASALRRELKSGIADNLARSGLPPILAGEESQAGEALIPFFVERMGGVLDAVEELG